jgi:hypothetical protein
MRRTIRILGKVALGFFAIATVVFGILCYILYAHEQEIADELIAVFNEGQSGQLTYLGVELSPFRTFP